jgi:hypothetical protein
MVLLLLIEFSAPEFTGREMIGGLIGALLFLAGLLKAIKDIRADGWQPFKERWITPRKARRERQEAQLLTTQSLVETCEEMKGQICEILKEVKPNGGTSLKDRVIGIDNKVENIVARVQHQDETSEVPTFHLDAEGKMVYTNCSFRELVNAEEGQLSHHDYLSLMEESDRQVFVRSRAESIEYKMPIDVPVKYKTAPNRTVRMQASPDVRHGSVLRGFFGTATEVEQSQ